MIVLTSMHDKVKDTSDQWKKPHVHVIYDHTKGGIDIVDLLSTNHSTRITSKRWPVNALAFALDTCTCTYKSINELFVLIKFEIYIFYLLEYCWSVSEPHSKTCLYASNLIQRKGVLNKIFWSWNQLIKGWIN